MVFWSKKGDEEELNVTTASESQRSQVVEPIEQHKPSTTVTHNQSGARPEGVKSAPVAEVPAVEGSSSQFDSNERLGKVRSVLGAGTVVHGKLSFDTTVRIDGKLSGEIFSSKALILGETAEVNAELNVAILVVLGSVKGTIKATEKIELRSKGKLEGDIQTPSLVIEDGAVFNGKCSMGIVSAARLSHSANQDSVKKPEKKPSEAVSAARSGAETSPPAI